MLPKLFAWPIKPYIVNQRWGVHDPNTYARFGFSDHNGQDYGFATDKRIHSAFGGTVVRVATRENGKWQPNGGGIFVSVLSKPIEFPEFTNVTPDGRVVHFAAGTYRVLTDYLHCESIAVSEGQQVETGTLLAIGDNTGFSTGQHCHGQWRRVTEQATQPPAGVTQYRILNENVWLMDADKNDANNSFDPTILWDGFFAQDVPNYLTWAIQQLRAFLFGRS